MFLYFLFRNAVSLLPSSQDAEQQAELHAYVSSNDPSARMKRKAAKLLLAEHVHFPIQEGIPASETNLYDPNLHEFLKQRRRYFSRGCGTHTSD